jgi:hypothetical protein
MLGLMDAPVSFERQNKPRTATAEPDFWNCR